MRRRLHRLGLSLLFTAGVIVWQQQESRSIKQSSESLPFSLTAQATHDNQPSEEINNSEDSEIRALLKAVQPLRLLKRD